MSLEGANRFSKKSILLIAEKNEIVNSQNFKKEIDKFFEDMSYVNLREEEYMHYPKTVYACNPEYLQKVEGEFDFVIVDEATLAKETTSKRFKLVQQFCDKAEYVVLLSGTPMMNGSREIYAPLQLLDHPLGTMDKKDYETVFAGGHMRKIRDTGKYYMDYLWFAKGANHIRELKYLIQDNFYFVTKDEAGVFKKKERRLIRVPMTTEWEADYNRAWLDYKESLPQKYRNMSPSVFAKKLENISEMQKIIENGKVYQINSKWKARKAVDMLKDIEGRVVVFTIFVETFEEIQQYLAMKGISYRTFDDIAEWKKGDEKVLLGRTKAHGKGGNAPEAHTTIFVDMDYVPANNLQAENRMDRPEQENDMQALYLITEQETVDQHVQGINRDKIRRINTFMSPLLEAEQPYLKEQIPKLEKDYQVTIPGNHRNVHIHGKSITQDELGELIVETVKRIPQ